MQTIENNEWVVFLNGKIFYLAASHSIKDEESGKAFFENVLQPAGLPTPQVKQHIEIPHYPLQFEDSQVH